MHEPAPNKAKRKVRQSCYCSVCSHIRSAVLNAQFIHVCIICFHTDSLGTLDKIPNFAHSHSTRGVLSPIVSAKGRGAVSLGDLMEGQCPSISARSCDPRP
jgi:hypothetical protein